MSPKFGPGIISNERKFSGEFSIIYLSFVTHHFYIVFPTRIRKGKIEEKRKILGVMRNPQSGNCQTSKLGLSCCNSNPLLSLLSKSNGSPFSTRPSIMVHMDRVWRSKSKLREVLLKSGMPIRVFSNRNYPVTPRLAQLFWYLNSKQLKALIARRNN